ncbi:MAG: zinc ABC transporter solute-binding protein [FCB group bacterium]|nr:zinc ABC transporter solute-binding protein [FCB group bacterium]
MRISIIWTILIGVILFAFAATFSVADDKAQTDRLRVFVGILPQAYIVEQVGGDIVKVGVLIGPGQSPETFDPTPKDIIRLFEIDAYFQIGLPFETRLIQKASDLVDNFNVVDTRLGITLRTISDHHHGDFIHQGETDPHIWLDPELLKIQAQTICHELSRLRPNHTGLFEANLKVLETRLDLVDSTVADLLAPLNGAGFFVFHPSYGYFADRYGLKQVAVETGGKEPGAHHLTELIEEARRENISAIFIQPQFSTKTAEAIAHEIDSRIVILDPLARNCVDNLETMARDIFKVLNTDNKGVSE